MKNHPAWLLTALKYANKIQNNKLMKLYYFSNTVGDYFLFPILMEIFKNKIIVLIILAFL